MYSEDIYEKVIGKVVKKVTGNENFNVYKDELPGNIEMSEYYQALIDYTNEKIFEMGNQEDYVEDIGVMFDKLDSAFTSQKEQDEFFQNYIALFVFLSLTVYNKPLMIKPCKAEKAKEYPNMVESCGLDYFEILIDSSPKENAICLIKHIMNRKVAIPEYAKK